MKRVIANRMRPVLLTIGLISLFASCIKEDVGYIPRAKDTSGIEFTLKLPNSGNSGTRALTPAEEDAVEDIRLLVFKPDGGTYEYTVTPTPVSGFTNRYVAKLSTGNCDLILLVNSADHISNIFGSSIPATTTLSTFTTQLQVSIPAKWNADPGSTGYMPIPMWAYKKNVTIAQNTSFTGDNDNFKLLRMLARINVSVADSAQEKFTLTSVSVYNRQDKGQIVPVLGNLNAAMTLSESPSLASGASQIKGPLRYDGTAIQDQKECINEIYVFEAPAGMAADFPNYPCIVVGGTYDGVPGYYRIDFAKQTGTQVDYLALTRNKTYDVTINSVSAPGYNTDENAYNARPVNIEADIIEWDDGGVNAWTDGQYLLTIDPGQFFFYRETKTEDDTDNRMKIWTDYPEGWKLEGIEYIDTQTGWLEFMGGYYGHVPEETHERYLKLARNDSYVSRTAYVIIRAGRIRAKVKVVQSAETELYMRVYIAGTNDLAEGEYKFSMLPWENVREEFMVEWWPKDAQVNLKVNPVRRPVGGGNYDPLVFIGREPYSDAVLSGPQNNYNDDTNTFPFNLILDNYRDYVNEAQSRGWLRWPYAANEYIFSARYKDRYVEQKLKIEYEYLDVQSTRSGSCTRLLQNRDSELPVTFNTDFKVTFEGYDILTNASKNSLAGRTFSPQTTGTAENGILDCMAKNNESLNCKSAWIVFSDPASGKEFRRLEIRSYYQYPNSYLINGGRTELQIPISVPFYVWREMFTEPINDITLTARLLWEDENGLVAGLGLDADVDNIDNSIINVRFTPGKSGNASVALCGYGDDGVLKILWSWHLWVADYDPLTDYLSMQIEAENSPGQPVEFKMMTMNLGALNIVPGDKWSYGYYYQWGRKDPFPPFNNYNPSVFTNLVTNQRPLYNVMVPFQIVSAQSMSSYPLHNKLKPSILNPTSFLTADWDWYVPLYGQTSDRNWREDKKLKGLFDPCPEGWTVAGEVLGTQIPARSYQTPSFDPPTGENQFGWTFDDPRSDGQYHPYRGSTIWTNNGGISGSSGNWGFFHTCFTWLGEGNTNVTSYTFFISDIFSADGTPELKIGATSRSSGYPVRCVEDKEWWVVKQ